jgi:hypothetical protein
MFSSSIKDPKVLGQLRRLRLVMFFAAIILFSVIGAIYLIRLQTFDRAVATIETVWDEHQYGNGEKHLMTFAMLTFTRVSADGQSHDCRHPLRIGRPSDKFQAGEKLEIIPATGTCQRADILGRIDRAR